MADMWEKLNGARTSHFGVVLFYGYLVAIVASGVMIGTVVLQNRAALDANRAAIEANRTILRKSCLADLSLRKVERAAFIVRLHDPGTSEIVKVAFRKLILELNVDPATCNRKATP